MAVWRIKQPCCPVENSLAGIAQFERETGGNSPRDSVTTWKLPAEWVTIENIHEGWI